DEHLHELPAVVDQEREADEVGHDGAVARPRLDRLLGLARALDLGDQALVNMGALLERSTHRPSSSHPARCGKKHSRRDSLLWPGIPAEFPRRPGHWCLPGRRRRMIAEFDGLRFFRVLPPLASTPVGPQGCRPPAVRPSPPPIGWLTGFIEVPRLCGLRPIQRLRPAFPRLIFMWSAFPRVPIVARQSEL